MAAKAVAWFVAATVATATAVTYSAVQSHRETKAAGSAAKKEAERQRKWQEQMAGKELEAGEYFEQLNMQQMELQTQASSITTLANLIAATKQTAAQPQVFTLPAAKTYDPVTRINQAIHEMLGGK